MMKKSGFVEEENITLLAKGVLIKVAYTALITVDIEVGGQNALLGDDAFPYVPGFTVSGTVARLGEGVDPNLFSVGDRVGVQVSKVNVKLINVTRRLLGFPCLITVPLPRGHKSTRYFQAMRWER